MMPANREKLSKPKREWPDPSIYLGEYCYPPTLIAFIPLCPRPPSARWKKERTKGPDVPVWYLDRRNRGSQKCESLFSFWRYFLPNIPNTIIHIKRTTIEWRRSVGFQFQWQPFSPDCLCVGVKNHDEDESNKYAACQDDWDGVWTVLTCVIVAFQLLLRQHNSRLFFAVP